MRSKLWVSWVNAVPVKLTKRTAATRARRIIPSLDQWTGIFQITIPDGVGGPVRQGAYRVGRVVAVILREHRRAAGHKDVVHVPALAIAVEHAARGVSSHHRAAGIMRGLIDRAVVRALAW